MRSLSLAGPSPTTTTREVVLYEEEPQSLNYKLLLLNLLLRGSTRTMVFTEASQSQVFLAGAAYGAKCGMSDPSNLPSSLHYQLASLHQHGLLHCWAQHGHDGLPQRAGFSAEDVVEVYNSWFDLPDNPHNLEIEKLRTEVAACDLLILLETGDSQADRASLTRQTLLHSVLREDNTHSLGLVVISRTPCEESGLATLNIYSEAEEVVPRLVRSLDILHIPSSPRNVSCLHRAQAMVPYDTQGRRTAGGKMRLSLEVGERVKLSPCHDHKLIPAYTTVKKVLTDVQKKKLSSPGPKYGSVTRLLPEKCAFEVSQNLLQPQIYYLNLYQIRLCGVPILLGAWWLDAAAKGNKLFLVHFKYWSNTLCRNTTNHSRRELQFCQARRLGVWSLQQIRQEPSIVKTPRSEGCVTDRTVQVRAESDQRLPLQLQSECLLCAQSQVTHTGEPLTSNEEK